MRFLFSFRSLRDCVTFSFMSIFKAPKKKLVEFANRVVPDEAARNELPHLDLHCLPSSLRINMINLGQIFFEILLM